MSNIPSITACNNSRAWIITVGLSILLYFSVCNWTSAADLLAGLLAWINPHFPWQLCQSLESFPEMKE
jgi:hypothetical protein